jgi:hypothetical protein
MPKPTKLIETNRIKQILINPISRQYLQKRRLAFPVDIAIKCDFNQAVLWKYQLERH